MTEAYPERAVRADSLRVGDWLLEADADGVDRWVQLTGVGRATVGGVSLTINGLRFEMPGFDSVSVCGDRGFGAEYQPHVMVRVRRAAS